MTLVVRRAGTADAGAIAEVHVASWRVAYHGLLPAALLDGLTAEQRRGGWERGLADSEPSGGTLVAVVGGGSCATAVRCEARPAVPARVRRAVCQIPPYRWMITHKSDRRSRRRR